MIESAADRALFCDPAAFGATAAWHPAGGGGPIPLRGVFTPAHAVILGDVSGLAPVMVLSLDAGLPAVGDELRSLGGANWRVADVQPDGTGMARLILEKI